MVHLINIFVAIYQEKYIRKNKGVKNMKCKQCGVELLDTDQFCPKCGFKIVKERRCPDCGTILRDGMKFCHECGRLVGTDDIDIPIADIEKNILLETEHELGGVRTNKQEKKPKEVVHKETIYDEDIYEEESSRSMFTIVSVVMAILIFAIAAFLIFTAVRNRPIKNYGESIQNEQENEGASNGEEQAENAGAESTQVIGTLSIVSNVNVRDYPSTEGTNIIKVAKAGDMYQYCGKSEDNNWYQILLEDGSTGYVFFEYVKEE